MEPSKNSPVLWKKLRDGLKDFRLKSKPMKHLGTGSEHWGGEECQPVYNRRRNDKPRGAVPWYEPYERRKNPYKYPKPKEAVNANNEGK